MSTLTKGSLLSLALRSEVLGAYVYRWTRENDQRVRAYGYCQHCGVQGGKPDSQDVACRAHHPTVPLQSDAEWLREHSFYVTKAGRLDLRRRYAEPAYLAG